MLNLRDTPKATTAAVTLRDWHCLDQPGNEANEGKEKDAVVMHLVLVVYV